MDLSRLLAIDPSLTCSGWACFDIKNRTLTAIGKIHSIPHPTPLPVRLADLQLKISKVFDQLNLSENDVLICEGETTMRDPRAAIRVERVRSIFEAIARTFSAVVPGRVNPRSVQYEVMGLKGKQLGRPIVKEIAARTALALHEPCLRRLGFDTAMVNLKRNQDIVDAILVGDLALSWIHTAKLSEAPLEEVFGGQRNRQARKVGLRFSV